MKSTLLLLWFAACSAGAVTVTDFAGREVSLAQPARRIVALAPHIVENLFSAGAGEKLVGAVAYSNYPPAAMSVPSVGAYNAFSLEQIAALRPDLVVLWGSGNGMQNLAKFEQLGITVYVSELRRLPDIPASIRRLAQLAGTGEHGEAAALRIERGLAELQARYTGARRIRVFYEIWNEPLQTVNGEHMISELISLCGGDNIFADAAALAPRISMEAVLARDPEAIVASGMGEARPEWLDRWRDFPGLAAVAGDALFFIPPDYVQRPTARIIEGARQLCSQLERVRVGVRGG